ncbi:MAG: tetratricopeptide repeat protein [Gammaproteobacteria bacterium]|nr:tetratricopeptide repeat protein [Gammaproteobacteria bacterium]
MRVLKWLFQPVYLLLLIVLVALYVNREVIFSETLTASPQAEELIGKVDTLVARLRPEVEQPLPATAPHVVADESLLPPVDGTESSPAPAGDSDRQQPSSVEPSFAQEESEQAESEEAVAAVVVAEAPPSESGSAGGAADGGTVGAEPASPPDGLLAFPEEGAPLARPLELDGVAAPPLVISAEEPEPTPEPLPASSTPVPPLEIWHAARAAVWQGDLEGAVAHYHQLIAAQPDNFDAYGELGNVLLAQADVAAALEAYTAAARLIHQAGYHEMAYRLAAIVARMDEEQGRALLGEFSAE